MPIQPPLDPAIDVLPPAPLELLREAVRPEWIDYNGHLNVAYYVLVFDHATDRLFDLLDIGAAYVKRTNHSAFVLETHVGYRREVTEGAPLRVTGQLLDADDKRLHIFFRMLHAEQGFLSATSELLCLHVDLGARRAAPFPAEVRRRMDHVLAAQAELPRPDEAGRSIGIRRGG
jgi:acyl-CoA thioester hydrolase